MKPEPEVKDVDNESLVAGDVIGDTAYSERFVLKILLKFANLDTLKEEIKEKSFEDDLCMLWDMTAERDVVLFLQKHDVLKLFNFALPIIDCSRVIEIIVGIIANMCCQKEAVSSLLKLDDFLKFLMEYIKSDDTPILVQLLRLISSSLFVADDNDISTWIGLFKNNNYANLLYFILKNSSNRELLTTGLENLNTVCSYCNTEKFRTEFYSQFINDDAIDSVVTALVEVIDKDRDKTEMERMILISIQITMNIIGFHESFDDESGQVVKLINVSLEYYENKTVKQKEIDTDLIDIIESIVSILKILVLQENFGPGIFFTKSYKIWKALHLMMLSDRHGEPNFEASDKDELKDFSKKIKIPLSTLICIYLEKCSEKDLMKCLDDIDKHYEDIVSDLEDQELLQSVTKRTENYKTRLKDTVAS